MFPQASRAGRLYVGLIDMLFSRIDSTKISFVSVDDGFGSLKI